MQNAAPSIVTNGLVLYIDSGNPASYSGTGSSCYDLSGQNNNGTLYNLTYDTSNQGLFVFNGTSSYINIPSSSSILPSTGVITTMSWFKATATGTENGSIILNKENEYEISAGGGYISYAFRPNWAWVGSTAFNINRWYCVAVTYDQSYQKLYINGSLSYSAALSGAIGNVYTNDLRIGARGAPDAAYAFFAGQIPLTLIYNRALSQQEVQGNYFALAQRFNMEMNI